MAGVFQSDPACAQGSVLKVGMHFHLWTLLRDRDVVCLNKGNLEITAFCVFEVEAKTNTLVIFIQSPGNCHEEKCKVTTDVDFLFVCGFKKKEREKKKSAMALLGIFFESTSKKHKPPPGA